jgi:hypothetical protein
MPPRFKVVTMLPAHIRAEVERRILETGFSDSVRPKNKHKRRGIER